MINEKFDKIELMKHQDEINKEHTIKKQLDSLRQDFLENNKLINHLFKEYKSLSSLLQATVSPWLPQKSHNVSKYQKIKISKSKRGVPPNRLIVNNKLRNKMEKWLPIN